MQPKQTTQQIRQQIEGIVGELNMHALAHYAFLLERCGVKQPCIFYEFFLP